MQVTMLTRRCEHRADGRGLWREESKTYDVEEGDALTKIEPETANTWIDAGFCELVNGQEPLTVVEGDKTHDD